MLTSDQASHFLGSEATLDQTVTFGDKLVVEKGTRVKIIQDGARQGYPPYFEVLEGPHMGRVYGCRDITPLESKKS